jgi:hypothetical protein
MMDYIQKYIFEIILGATVAGVTRALVNLKKRNKATQDGVKALLRDRIIALYDKYMDKGYMPIHTRENVQELYKEYKKLGGNGVIDHLIEDLYSLPTKSGGVTNAES